jgi:hypothetical protein
MPGLRPMLAEVATESRDFVGITHQFAGRGAWRSQGFANRIGHSWQAHAVKWEDGSMRATLSVPGVAELQGLTAEGHIDGRDVFGVLANAEGEQLTTFEVTLDADGNGGTYVLGNGDSGSWGFDVATGREVRKLMGVEADVAVAAE